MAKLSKTDIEIVRSSFRQLGLISEVLAAIFYERLLEALPGVRGHFKTGALMQYRMLVYGLGQVIKYLDNPKKLSEVLEYLRKKHDGLDLKKSDYDKAKEALLFTLSRGFGRNYSGKLENAWRRFADQLLQELGAKKR
ncbi:globin domain-containing protein [Bradyrhizobium sp. S3.2.12]|uniref:globin domain-containing protein n=1 Tax=Bradyrhizobium sp. S3.2.12 TaxID=3156387 RepID=UPI00339B2AD3